MKTGTLTGLIVLVSAGFATSANAVPTFVDANAAHFEVADSQEFAGTFTMTPGSDPGDNVSEIKITINHGSAPPPAPVVKLKENGGTWETLVNGSSTTIAGHSVFYADDDPSTTSATTSDPIILITHSHDSTTTDTWHLCFDVTSDAFSYAVDPIDFADFTVAMIQPDANSGGDRSADEGGSENLGVGLGTARVRHWEEGPGTTPGILSYEWSEASSFLSSAEEIMSHPAGSVINDETRVLTFQVTDSTFPDLDPMVNSEDMNFQVQARNARDVYLVLDHSGSMLSENRWTTTVQAASLFVDLFRRLRNDDQADDGTELPDADRSRVGHLIFEKLPCGWTPSAPISTGPGQIVPGAFDYLANVDARVGDSYTTEPWGCTPIGDGIQQARLEITAPIRDNPIFVVMSDGMENSGRIQLGDSIANEQLAGQTFPGWSGTSFDEATFYTLSVGETSVAVDDILSRLSTVGSGEGSYRRAANVSEELEPFFMDTLNDILGANLVTGVDDDSGGKIFTVNGRERRVAFVVVWDTTISGAPALYPHLSYDDTWATVDPVDIDWDEAGSSDYPNVVQSHRSGQGYAFLVVDEAVGSPLDGQWTVTVTDNTGGDISSIPEGAEPRFFAIADPHLYADFSFDDDFHATGEPIVLMTEIREAGRIVTGATVTVELVKPLEGEGTVLVQNIARLKKMSLTQLSDSVLQASVQTQLGDSTLREAALQAVLDELGQTGLRMGNDSIQLHDDGNAAHGDFRADDGIYSNIFTDTAKEGTYTFRYVAEGTANSGTPFSRTGIISNFVGVNIDPGASDPNWKSLPSAGGMRRAEYSITPRSITGEYFGMYRPELLRFDVTDGSLVGSLVDYQNGRYGQEVTWSSNQSPVLVATVNGVSFPPSGPGQRPTATQVLMWIFLLLILLLLFLIYRCVCRRGPKANED